MRILMLQPGKCPQATLGSVNFYLRISHFIAQLYLHQHCPVDFEMVGQTYIYGSVGLNPYEIEEQRQLAISASNGMTPTKQKRRKHGICSQTSMTTAVLACRPSNLRSIRHLHTWLKEYSLASVYFSLHYERVCWWGCDWSQRGRTCWIDAKSCVTTNWLGFDEGLADLKRRWVFQAIGNVARRLDVCCLTISNWLMSLAIDISGQCPLYKRVYAWVPTTWFAAKKSCGCQRLRRNACDEQLVMDAIWKWYVKVPSVRLHQRSETTMRQLGAEVLYYMANEPLTNEWAGFRSWKKVSFFFSVLEEFWYSVAYYGNDVA